MHEAHKENKLGCPDCALRVKAALLAREIAADPNNYDPATGLFRKPRGFQYGHNLSVLQERK